MTTRRQQAELEKELFRACKAGNVDRVRRAIAAGVDPKKAIAFSGETPLHTACEYGRLELVKYFVEVQGYSTECTNYSLKQTPLHYACQFGHLEVVKYLIEVRGCSTGCTDDNGKTPLLLACWYGRLELVKYLIEVQGCATGCTNYSLKQTLLDYACQNGQLEVVKYLIEVQGCSTGYTDDEGQTLLHLACLCGHLEVVKYLIVAQGCSAGCTDCNGKTPLHLACWYGKPEIVKYMYLMGVQEYSDINRVRTPLHDACKYGKLEIVKYLIEVQGCSAGCTDNSGQTPLHLACEDGKLEIVKYLIKVQGCSAGCTDNSGRTPLHLACQNGKLEIVKYLIGVQGCSTGCTDNSGQTPLHLACQFGQDVYNKEVAAAIIASLLEHCHCDPNSATHDGKTPLDLARCSEHIRLLLKFGATPSKSLMNKYFPRQLQEEPADESIKMFILGNSGAGKSTLVKSLKTEGDGMLARFKHRISKVTDVDERTAGIIPYDIESKALGRVTLYDFAGHREFYAGHDALLRNSMTASPSIVALVIDMRGEEGLIRETLQYWFEFINNHSTEGRSESHLVIVGSHIDTFSSRVMKLKLRFLQSITRYHNLDNILIAGEIMLDCRYAESASLSQLRSLLSHSCQALRNIETMAITHHSFLMFLFDRFRYKPAVKLDVAKQEMIRYAKYYVYLNCVISSNLIEVCEMLNKRGDILFMKNNQQPESSWIVFDKAVLLSQVNGVIFAPEGFKEHQNISTSTGVVPLSKLAPLFPDINSDMITQFLCHLEFCQEIKELELASLLVAEGQSTPTAGERYFFFPGLVHLDTPPDVIESGASKLDYNSGWVLQCSKPEQFFSSRFLQVLLLRLAFLFALAPTDPSTGDRLALHRKCSVWKNGIYWVNRSGGEAIVEINNLRQVMVIVRSKLEKMELVRLRSAVIKTVISAKEEFCSKVLVRESLILPEDAAVYPLDPSKVTGVSITEVAATIAEGKKFAIIDKTQSIELEKLICFEPYAYLGEDLLQQIFSEEEITEKLLTDIATKYSCKSIDKYCVVFEQEIDACASRELKGARGLLQVFQLWRDRMGKKGTRKNFRKKLDQFSVFAGRNPLELITRRTSPAVAESVTNPTDHADQHISQYHESDPATSISTASACCGDTDSQDYDRNASVPNIGDRPTLHELQLLEGVGGRKVRVIERVAPDWKDLAIALGFDQSRIMIIEEDCRGRVERASQEMFMRWLDGEHDLVQPCTWDTLIKCLRRAAFGDVANSLRAILKI